MTISATFYSYKGGSGRTTVLLNTVRHLIRDLDAENNGPILLVDADLESAGLTFYFEAESRFRGARLSTNMIFEQSREVLRNDDLPIIFGEQVKESERKCEGSMAWDIICNRLNILDKSIGQVPKIAEVLSDISLPKKYFALLHTELDRYLNEYEKAKENGSSSSELNSILWPLFNLKEEMIERTKGKDEAESARIKSEMLREFLPTRSFLDVSRYFAGDEPIKPGTVMFLGTDVSNESRVPRNHAAACINDLIDVCEERSYSAVIFDSGSGTQASAYMLHHASDVIVYCMRPTIQFIRGTRDNLYRFEKTLLNNFTNRLEREGSESVGKKIVVLMPNAVPDTGKDDPFCKDSFDEIQDICTTFDKYVDNKFCSYDTCLHEVSVFKWHEKILGCTDFNLKEASKDLANEVEKYSHENMLPQDAKAASKVYHELSKCIIDNA